MFNEAVIEKEAESTITCYEKNTLEILTGCVDMLEQFEAMLNRKKADTASTNDVADYVTNVKKNNELAKTVANKICCIIDAFGA